MQTIQELSAIPDDVPLHPLAVVVDDSRRTEADLVARVAEVDARELYAREATPSMFQHCTERLHLSGAEAYLRIAAGRAARRHPIILTTLADGRLHLAAVALLAPHLTHQNRVTDRTLTGRTVAGCAITGHANDRAATDRAVTARAGIGGGLDSGAIRPAVDCCGLSRNTAGHVRFSAHAARHTQA